MLNGVEPLLVFAALGVGLVIHMVWMGLALGAVLKKLGSAAVQAWIPVLRWVAAARVGRTSTIAVTFARSLAFLGATVTLVAAVVVVLTEPSGGMQDTLLIATLAGALLWLLGSLTGWVLWIYGAGTIQMRMRAPRGLTWIAALWPPIWASVIGWGKYRAIGGGEASAGAPVVATGAALPASAASAPATPVAPQPSTVERSEPQRFPDLAGSVSRSADPASTSSPAPVKARSAFSAGDEPAPARVSPFASLAPKDDPPPPPPPGTSSPTRSQDSAASPAPPAAPAPEVSPVPPPPPPAVEPASAPSALPASPEHDVAQYISQLSPYLAAQPVESVGPATPTPAAEPAPATEPAPAASPDSWVERMRENDIPAAQVSAPAPPPPVTDPPAPAEPPAPTPSTPQPEPVRAPESMPKPEPEPSTVVTGAQAVVPTISPPPADVPPPPATAAPTPSATAEDDDDDDDDDHTVLVRRARDSWTLKIGNASYALGGDAVVLGRATATTRPGILGVSDTTRTMSKRHAELIRRDDGWWVRDLGSTNGTYVRAADGSERRIEGTDSQFVDGDLVLGDLVMQIVKGEAN